MKHKVLENAVRDLKEKKNNSKDRYMKPLNVDLLERITQRLIEFSDNCDECTNFITDLTDLLNDIIYKQEPLDKKDFMRFQSKLKVITQHMEKEHNLLPDGHYISMYLPLGISFGLIFGLILFDNISMGLPLGVAFGLIIGSSMDADAKKKGKTI
ncbi:hypothetical protein I5677_06965 [Mobilitalea sibirica]|uniref:Glycine zipper-like domain-containing protein n=1 Tax=Mobilitalea sibirica TaxID=1462919 RepID=A0A8J7H8X9_9FIRM|nr:hypothetical protein [Mobilitalea sibirica]MBH1940625.1 hypothetical protein [Mobilitalea sibirica]